MIITEAARNKRWLPLLLAGMGIVLIPGLMHAQDITISAQVQPQQAAVGQSIQLTVSIEGKVNIASSPKLPDLPDFQVYGGGRSSNFSFVNGQVFSSLSFNYVLVARRAGALTIGPISIEHAGQVYSTQPITVTIGTAAAPSAQPQTASPGKTAPTQPVPEGQGEDQAVFLTAQVSDHEVYVNEPVTLSVRLFSRQEIQLANAQYQPPDTSGFWVEDLPPQREYAMTVKGNPYHVEEIKTTLFPTTAGTFTISSARLSVVMQDVMGRFQRGQDPFSMFFRDFGQQVTLQSRPITVKVKPLPAAGRPADFTGTVGEWSLSAKLDRSEVKVGEAVTLEVRIFGQGNVKSVGKPSLPPLTGFKVYDTISSSEVQKKDDIIRGVKIYRTLLRPEVTGQLTIPAIPFNYFNPRSNTYETVKVPELKLTVLPGEAGAGSAAPTLGLPANAGNAPGVKVMAQDIRYLKTQLPLAPAARPLPGWAWLLGFGLPPLLVFALWSWQKWQDKLIADPKYARKLAADKSARQALQQAHRARLHRETKTFYAQLALALAGYLADQLGASRSGITQRELLQRLKDLRADQGMLQRLADLFQECDYARFAPSDRDPEEMAQHEHQAEELLVELARVVRQERKA